MTTPESRRKRAAHVIVLREHLIAQDLGMMIADVRPEAVVFHATTLNGAEQIVPEDVKVALAVVEVRPDRYLASPLAARVAKDGGKVVFAGLESADLAGELDPQNWSSLTYPFNVADVLNVLGLTQDESPGSV